ncbi:MAG: N-acetylneuraminate synthase [Planctomycetaceae bacterium]|nr:N-acetylneuraminate synthase [Planctomycetaceae bacterium]
MTPPQTISIGRRIVGEAQPCFVIAEAGVNHNGRLDLAEQLIDAAADAGADAVKFQTFRADRIVTRTAPQAQYQQQNMGKTQSQYDMLKALELSDDDHLAIVQHCKARDVLFMSTPFDEQSATFLNSLDMQVFKMPSGEITNLPFLRHVAQFNRPMIVSTGMSTLGEVEAAVTTIEEAGNSQIMLLHCVSNYPAPPREVNLRAMLTMRSAFGYLTGYSDHTLGIEVGIASSAMGACVLEKHYTLDRTMPGPDHAASAEPDELRQLIRGIRNVEAALGTGLKRPSASELDTARVARKSLVAAFDIAEGTQLTDEMIAIRRPGTGLPPAMKPHLLNRRVRVNLVAGDLLQLEDVA